MPLLLVILPRSDRKIYDSVEICHLAVRIETLRNASSLGQCYRCQKFGHAQSRCSAPFKCLKCAQSHPTFECPKARLEPATCANCGGSHPANFRLCPSRPKPKLTQTTTTPINPWQEVSKPDPPKQNQDFLQNLLKSLSQTMQIIQDSINNQTRINGNN